MKKFTFLLMAFFTGLLSTYAQDWSGKTFTYYDIHPGYIISESGDTTKGYVEHGNRTSNQKNCIFYTDASKKEKKKYKPSELKGYGVADKHYRTIAFSGGLLAKPVSFVLLAKPGRISQYMYYTKKDGIFSGMTSNETQADYDARIHTDEIVWQKLDEKPIQQADFALGFAKKMSKLMSDYPEIAAKIENKEEGYGLFKIYNIMEEYNKWWEGKK